MKKFVRRFSCFAIMMFIISILPFSVLASDTEETKNEANFKITSGLDLKKKKESTFDKKRTISGTAQEGTMVTINIYSENDVEDKDTQKSETVKSSSDTAYKDEQFYEITVGASGIFSQTVYFNLGENLIEMTVDYKDNDAIEKNFVINRKSREIKQELENTIVLPGEIQSSEKLDSNDVSSALDQLKK